MLSRNLICFSHLCRKNPSKPILQTVCPMKTTPLKDVKVNLDFISRLPKLLEINWKCIYAWEKTKIVHKLNKSSRALFPNTNFLEETPSRKKIPSSVTQVKPIHPSFILNSPEDESKLQKKLPSTPVHKQSDNVCVSEEKKPLKKKCDYSGHINNGPSTQSVTKVAMPPNKIPNSPIPVSYTSSPIPKEPSSLSRNAQTPENSQYKSTINNVDNLLDIQRKMCKKAAELSLAEEYDKEDTDNMMRVKNRKEKLKKVVDSTIMPRVKSQFSKGLLFESNKKGAINSVKTQMPKQKTEKSHCGDSDYDKVFRYVFDFLRF